MLGGCVVLAKCYHGSYDARRPNAISKCDCVKVRVYVCVCEGQVCPVCLLLNNCAILSKVGALKLCTSDRCLNVCVCAFADVGSVQYIRLHVK